MIRLFINIIFSMFCVSTYYKNLSEKTRDLKYYFVCGVKLFILFHFLRVKFFVSVKLIISSVFLESKDLILSPF